MQAQIELLKNTARSLDTARTIHRSAHFEGALAHIRSAASLLANDAAWLQTRAKETDEAVSGMGKKTEEAMKDVEALKALAAAANAPITPQDATE